jgi:hypothetical protein
MSLGKRSLADEEFTVVRYNAGDNANWHIPEYGIDGTYRKNWSVTGQFSHTELWCRHYYSIGWA